MFVHLLSTEKQSIFLADHFLVHELTWKILTAEFFFNGIFLMPSSGKSVSHMSSTMLFIPVSFHGPFPQWWKTIIVPLVSTSLFLPFFTFSLGPFPSSLSYLFGPPPSPLPHSPLGSPFKLYSRAPLSHSSVFFFLSSSSRSWFLFRSSRVTGHVWQADYFSLISQLYFMVSCRYYSWRYGNVSPEILQTPYNCFLTKSPP